MSFFFYVFSATKNFEQNEQRLEYGATNRNICPTFKTNPVNIFHVHISSIFGKFPLILPYSYHWNILRLRWIPLISTHSSIYLWLGLVFYICAFIYKKKLILSSWYFSHNNALCVIGRFGASQMSGFSITFTNLFRW